MPVKRVAVSLVSHFYPLLFSSFNFVVCQYAR